MEQYSEASSRKKFINYEETQSIKNLLRKSLLDLFIEYVWDDKNGELSGFEDAELVNWMTSANIDINNKRWDSSAKLRIRTESKIQLEAEITELNRHVIQTVLDWNKSIVYAELAYNLKNVLPFLINCKNDIKHADEDGQTILHVFLKGYLDTTEKLTQVQLTNMRNLIKELVARGASFYTLNRRGKSPLDVAAMCKNKEILELAICCLINVNERDKKGNAALHIVIRNCVDEESNEHKDGYVDIVRNLISGGANLNAKNERGETAVHLAAAKFHHEMLEFFADLGTDFDRHTNEDETPLHYVSTSSLKLRDKSRMVKTLDFLMSEGCDIECTNEKGYMPLHCAAEFATVEIAEKLIEHGADVNCQTRNLRITPLHLAAKANQLAVMRKLVEVGANVNAETVDGATPIFATALRGSFESMLFLIDSGADLRRRDKLEGFTLIHLVAFGIEPKTDQSPKVGSESAEYANGVEKLNYLITKGFDVNDWSNCGLTALQLAVLAVKIDTVKILVNCGANVNFQSDKSELTALHVAAMRKNLEMVETLIEAGACVKCTGGPDKWTALHFANSPNYSWTMGKYADNVATDSTKMTAFRVFRWSHQAPSANDISSVNNALIQRGSDANARDIFGRTPLFYATLRKTSDECRLLLRQSSAYVNVQDNAGQSPLSNAVTNSQIQILMELLDYGADINDPHIGQQIMNDRNLMYYALKHTIKLKMLGFPIADIYESFIRDREFSVFFKEYTRELNSLKNHRVGDSTLYQFLHMRPKPQYHYALTISTLYESLKKLYPIYFSVIHGFCREAIIRKSLVEAAWTAWTKVSNVHLPDVCIDIILSHMSNKYLDALIVGAQLDETISNCKAQKCVFQGTVVSNGT